MTTRLNLSPTAPTLNPFQLFKEYSGCVINVVDLNAMLDLTTVSSPVLLSGTSSYNFFSESYRRPPIYLVAMHGVISLTCMFTLLAYKPFPGSRRKLASYILYHLKSATGAPSSERIQIYPQTVAIFSQETELKFWASEHTIRQTFLPQIFFFPTSTAAVGMLGAKTKPKNFQGYFICWFCNQSTMRITQPAQTFQFSCDESCGNAMKLIVQSNVKNSGLYFWRWAEKPEGPRKGHDPFTLSNPINIHTTMGRFLNENYKNGTGPANEHFGIPIFQCSEIIDVLTQPPTHNIITGSAPSFNFITSAGINDAKTGYAVYFAPFTSGLWLTSLLIGIACLLTGFIAISIHAFKADKQQLFLEMSTWTITTMFGQYKNAGIPILRPRQMQQAISIPTVVVCWLLTVTVLNSFYQATFNSDATTVFPYLTNFSELSQLENCLLFVPVNDTLFTRMMKAMSFVEQLHGYTSGEEVCLKLFHDVEFSQCDIIELMKTTRDQRFKTEMDSPKYQDWVQETFRTLLINTHIIRNSEEMLERICDARGPNIAFVVWQHEFNYHWEMFVQLMKRRPDLKFANNFGKKKTRKLQRMTGCTFTGGLDPQFQNAMLTRLSRLLSSGIHDLWEKWDRIRFSLGGLRGTWSKLASATTVVAPVSFQNSGTPWLFLVTAVSWVLALLCFACELLISLHI